MNIAQIARLAGVSPSAVSRYLNNGYLSEEKKEAVRRVIEETGYRPLAQAQALRTRKTRAIGVILPKINSFTVSSVMAGIDSVLEPAGFQILLADTHNSPEKELNYLNVFDEQRVDGIILIATVFTPRHIAMLKKSRVPVVVAGQQLAGTSCVYHDDYHAFYDITTLLLAKGCRRLAYIGALPQDKAVGQERSRAYCDAVRDAGLGALADNTAIADFTISSGYETARRLWETHGALDGLVCATDAMAVGALQYLKSQGLRIPADVRLTGQGASDVCEVTTPAITTIRFFYEDSGVHAARLLLEHLKDRDAPVREIKLGYTILERGSTG